MYLKLYSDFCLTPIVIIASVKMTPSIEILRISKLWDLESLESSNVITLLSLKIKRKNN
jgi:hypothetical protein